MTLNGVIVFHRIL